MGKIFEMHTRHPVLNVFGYSIPFSGGVSSKIQLLLDRRAVCGTIKDRGRSDHLLVERGKSMLFQKKQFCLSCLYLFVLLVPCACSLGRVAPEQPARVYHNKPYDTVWAAVTEVILDELGCVERKSKKNSGYLETEWVHSLDTAGQHRWKIEAYLKQDQDSVTVTLEKMVQLKDTVSKTIRTYNNEKKKEPVGPHAGWSDTTTTTREIEELYRRIDLRLGE
jgi:hypothetical protein